MTLDAAKTRDFVKNVWETSAIPTLEEYIRIPNQVLPLFPALTLRVAVAY